MATQTQAPAKKPEGFLTLLDKSKGEFVKLVGDEVKAERILRICRTAYQLKPELQQCSPLSIISCAMKACELGLDPDGARQHAYLIKFSGACTLQVSYKGLLELANRSGAFRSIGSNVVRKGDTFVHEYNPEPTLRHVPGPSTEDKDITHAYAYVVLQSGDKVIEVMSRAEVDKVKACAQTGGVWSKWYGEMAKKTAIKRLLKRQPSSVELAEAIEHDNGQYGPQYAQAHGSGTSRLLNRLAPPSLDAEHESQEPALAIEDQSQLSDLDLHDNDANEDA